MTAPARILIALSDVAVAGTISEYLRLRNYAPQMIQHLTADELWMEAPLLIADGQSLESYDGLGTLPPALIILGHAEAPAQIAHREEIPIPLRLSDLGKAISRLLTRAAIGADALSVAAGLSFFPKERMLRSPSAAVELTEKEAALLLSLLQSRGQAAGREALLKEVWRYQTGVDTHTLETHIYRLRQKIADAGGSEKLISTVPDGYVLEAAASVG